MCVKAPSVKSMEIDIINEDTDSSRGAVTWISHGLKIEEAQLLFFLPFKVLSLQTWCSKMCVQQTVLNLCCLIDIGMPSKKSNKPISNGHHHPIHSN